MKPSAFLVNLARGGIVDEGSAGGADCARSASRAAALDVFATEPLPEDHPFWSMDNVIVTPAPRGFHDQYARKRFYGGGEFRKFLAGDTTNMLNVVKR